MGQIMNPPENNSWLSDAISVMIMVLISNLISNSFFLQDTIIVPLQDALVYYQKQVAQSKQSPVPTMITTNGLGHAPTVQPTPVTSNDHES